MIHDPQFYEGAVGLGKGALIVGGPTASGKTALALDAAAEFGGTVINADSQQLYEGLRILTARPTPAQEAGVPHRLYGVVQDDQVCSAGLWRDMALDACQDAWRDGRLPILVGGTGLYLKALIEGLAPVPPVPDAVRAAARALFAELGNAAFHAALSARDPLMGARLAPGNSQRLVRAWEVLEATGRSLALWQAEEPVGRFPGRLRTIVVMPARDDLYAACDRRFLRMLEQGAVAEVEALRARRLDPGLPVMKALGVPQLSAWLDGRLSKEAAVTAAQQATRNYAKRQQTWFRHQICANSIIESQYSERFSDIIFSFIRIGLLTTA